MSSQIGQKWADGLRLAWNGLIGGKFLRSFAALLIDKTIDWGSAGLSSRFAYQDDGTTGDANALALLASLDWTEAFRIKIIPDGGAIHSFLNWSVAVFALLCVAEFSSLAVGTIRNLADYILSTESQTRELLESAVAPDEDEE